MGEREAVEETPSSRGFAPQPVPQGFTSCPRAGCSAPRAQSTAGPWKTPPRSACARTATRARPPSRPRPPAPVSAPPESVRGGRGGVEESGKAWWRGCRGQGALHWGAWGAWGPATQTAGRREGSPGWGWGPGPAVGRTRTRVPRPRGEVRLLDWS